MSRKVVVRSNRLVLVLVALVGCTHSVEDALLEEQTVAPELIATRAGTLMLASAQVPPARTIRTAGSLTLEYVGPHEFPAASEGDLELSTEGLDVSDEDEDLEDPAGFRIGTATFVDSSGHEWRVIDSDDDAVATAAQEYRDAHGHDATPNDGGQTSAGDWDVFRDSGAGGARATWTVYDCSGVSVKWVYNPGSQSDLAGMNETQRMPILDDNPGRATSVLVAPNLALTAGHAAAGAIPGNQHCRKNANGSTTCRTISETFYEDDAGGNDDWGLIKFASSFPTPQYVYDLSVATDNTINNYTPRLAGYPTLRMGEEASCGTSALLEGERNLGTIHGLLQKEARLNITCGGGASGAPYYFFGNTNYEIFGIHSYRGNVLGNKFCGGPKVPYWVDDIVAAADALGVNL